MAVLKIARMGHPVLRRRAEAVEDPAAAEVDALIANMLETLQDAGGVGLAAPQVHVPRRIVVYFVPGDRMEEKDGEGVCATVLINPVVEPLSETAVWGWEGCLSVPGLMGAVERWTRVRVRASGIDGERLDYVAEGYHARVVQHECDHLDGVLYPQRMTDMSYLMFAEETRYGAPVLPGEAPPDQGGTNEY